MDVAVKIAIVATFIIYAGILWQTRQGRRQQNLLSWINHVEGDEVRKRRDIVRNLGEKPLNEWSPEEQECARKLCGTWNMTFILLNNKIIPKRVVVDNWSGAILGSYRLMQPYIKAERDKQSRKDQSDKEKSWHHLVTFARKRGVSGV